MSDDEFDELMEMVDREEAEHVRTDMTGVADGGPVHSLALSTAIRWMRSSPISSSIRPGPGSTSSRMFDPGE